MKRLAALVLALLAFAAAPAAEAQLTKQAKAAQAAEAKSLSDFETELTRASAAPDFVGLAVAVVKHGKIAMVRTFGVREAGANDKVTPDTVFRLASLSKGFAATLAELEMRDGRFKLADPVSKWAPEFRLPSEEETNAVTIENVLSQSTGLPPYAFDNLLEAGVAPAEILGRYADVKLSCPAGQCYSYQNTAFNMIAAVIEKTTGQPYAEEMKARLFGPLNLRTASIGLKGLMSTGDWAHPHVRKHGAWQPTTVKDAYYGVPAAGGVNCSITDLSLWLIAQMGGRPDVLPQPLLEDLHTPRINSPMETQRARILRMPVKQTRYDLGWRTYTYAGHTLVTHSGGVEGFFSQIAFLPESRDGIVILSNTRAQRATKLLPTWLDYELGLKKQDWLKLDELDDADATGTVE